MIDATTLDVPLNVRSLLPSGDLPLLIEPAQPGMELMAAFSSIRAAVDQHLLTRGGILFRGFGDPGREAFRDFAAAFGHPLLSYEFASTPRSDLSKGLYTATEYPPHQRIPLHNEQAYTREWPMRIWFYCEQPAQEAGETPIADSREIFRRIDPAIRRRFAEKELLYVRNYGNGLDLPWQKVFGCEDRAVVERYCRAHAIEWQWKQDGELRTRQRCQGVALHPKTRDFVWFNQAHLFHVSALDARVRDALLATLPLEDLPRNVYYGDGSEIEESALAEIRGVLDELMIIFPWRAGDVLMLDNMLTAHARSTFKGPRKVLVAMAEPYPS